MVAAALLAGGCSYANRPLNDNHVLPENRVANHTRAATFAVVSQPWSTPNPPPREIRPTAAGATPTLVDADGYFVGLAISGGGSRSANFAAACMFQLERVGLLRRVDYVSSVSGGSLTAAYYCSHGDGRGGWNPADVQAKLTHSFATDMLVQTALPWNWVALTLSDYDRSDLLAQTLKENLFTAADGHEMKYADLRPDRPRLLVNSTDLQSGRRFVFCNETFDDINADLAAYPLAYAVAASSSVPVVLHEVTLRDFGTDFPQYRHLIDGGVVDNLGIETLAETYRAQEVAARDAGRPDPYPHGAVFVILDASVEYDRDISNRSDTGFIDALTAAAGITSTALLDRASTAALDDVVLKNAPEASTAKQVRDAIDTLGKDGYVEFDNVAGHKIRVAHVALNQIEEISHLPFHSFGESVNSISTYFNIGPDQAAELYVAAELLMRNRFEPHLRALVKEMDDAASTRPTAGGNPGPTVTSPPAGPR